MNTSGNQYADKIFSEHPIAIWSLDEHVFYTSLIDDSHRLFSNWNLTNSTADDSPSLPSLPLPFQGEVVSSVISNTSSPVLVEAESPDLFSSIDISSNIKTFCVNLFLYQKPEFINWFKIGYRYTDALDVPQEVVSAEILAPSSESWLNFNQTYELPTSWSGSIKIFIQASFSDSSGGDATSRTLIMNGLSIGQESETTCYESLGSQKITIPDSIGISGIYGIIADQYGILSDNAYYVVKNNELLAKNDGFPIIYGTHQSTKIYPSNTNQPSLIFPGKGMLNESGRNKNYTLEMWMTLNPSAATAKKILGPISTNDGVYVKEGFISLAIGGEIGSHCISEWYRPMLIQILIKNNNATMLINGEMVIDIQYDKRNIDLPNDRDWWGVYSYPEISMFHIDCISIYPYSIPESVAKRRFVYGQGTPSIQSIDNGFFGTPTSIDFTTSEYNSSVIYPDIYRWDAGYFNNLTATRDYISVPRYELPTINLDGRDVKEWYENNYIINTLENPEGNSPRFISFRPNVEYDESGNPSIWNINGIDYTGVSYLNFPSLNILNDTLSAVYGIFEVNEEIEENRTLISFVNITTTEFFDIYVNSDSIYYALNGEILHQEIIQIDQKFLAGINFESFGSEFGYGVSRFFSSPSSVQVYVGGNGVNTFEGRMYSIGFSNQTDFERISENFETSGIAKSENYEIMLDHISSYTLIPEYEYGQMFLDISVSSEWEEYYPLSYFAGYVLDAEGNATYDLDFLQVNIGYTFLETEGVWTYQQLKDTYAGQTYSDLQSPIYTSYFNLYKNNTTGDAINFSNSSLQCYMTFQSLESGANTPLSSFEYTKPLTSEYVIYADNENTELFPEKVYSTKFAFKDNTIVYPPKTNNFEEYCMVLHLDLTQRSILKNPLKIKSLEVTSNALNYVSETDNPSQRNYIGTKFGVNIYPQKKVSDDIDYKSKNPIFIYKTSSPYLYTTKKSGIQVGTKTGAVASPEEEFMVSIPVNKNGSYDFQVGAIQFFAKSSFDDQEESIKMLDIKHKDGKISIILEKNIFGNKLKAYLNNGTTLTPASDVVFYQNGRYVVSPKLINDEWNAIGMSFTNPLDFSEYVDGSIDLFAGMVFNNISYYLSKGLGVKTDLQIRTWENVLNYNDETRSWAFWDTEAQSWKDVYVLGQSSSYINSPIDIYESYTGTNREIVDDGYGIRFNKKDSSIYSAVSWQTITAKPV